MWPERAFLGARGGSGPPGRVGRWLVMAAVVLALAEGVASEASAAETRPAGLPLSTIEIRWGAVHPADGWVIGGSAVPIVNRDFAAATLEIQGLGVIRVEPGETTTAVAPTSGPWQVSLAGGSSARSFTVVPEPLAAREPFVLDVAETSVTQRGGGSGAAALVPPLAALYLAFAAVIYLQPGRLVRVPRPIHPLAELSSFAENVLGRRAPDLTGEPCAGCQTLPCLSICPTRCFVRAESDPNLIELRTTRCVSCGLCTAACPRGAISMEWETRRTASEAA